MYYVSSGLCCPSCLFYQSVLIGILFDKILGLLSDSLISSQVVQSSEFIYPIELLCQALSLCTKL